MQSTPFDPRAVSSFELPPRAISFAGCAWLLPYHLGAAQGIARYVTLAEPYYLGASSGAIAEADVRLLSERGSWRVSAIVRVR